MWIFLNDSFLSIVATQNNARNLMVRARVKGDIERVFPEAKVRRTPDGDYHYRASIPVSLVAAALSAEVRKITYTNFKGSVPSLSRHDAYLDVWNVMRRRERMIEP